jgi:iron complex outermembrane recepter protein
MRALLKTTALLSASLMAMASGPAWAQAQGADEGIGEIIITAQKRAENVQDVPVAVSVLSSATLEKGSGFNIEGLNNLVPSLNFRKGGTNLNSSLFLRGVGTINFSIAAEPSVSTVLDGVVLARAGEAFGDLVDIERIEVLRGPQGTLFGKNASAGAVNVVSKRPGRSLGGQIEASYAEGNEWKLKGAVDVPFNDMVRGRFTAFYGKYDGNIYNRTTDSMINGYDRWGVRGLIEADPSETLRLTLIADYRKSNDNCCAEVIGTTPTGGQAAALALAFQGVNVQGDRTRQVRHNLITQTNEESYGVSLQADWDVGDHTITSITAYRKWNNREIREGDWLDTGANYVGINQLHDDGPQKSNTFTQELRVASPTGQFLEYVVGGFYYRAKADRVFTRVTTQCLSSTLPVDATGLAPCTAAASTFRVTTGTSTFGSVFENYAAFGQATANITEGFRIIAGLRYTRDELSGYLGRVSSQTIAVPGINPAFTFAGSTSKSNLSGKAGLQVDIADTSMAYATYSRGYKGPAYNIFFNMGATAVDPIAAETADAYEIGLKNTFLDGRLILNLAGYYAKYFNYQANNPDLVAGVVVTRLTNAGTVSTRGFELDMLARPTRNLSINIGLAYNDAKVDVFRLPPGGNPANVVPSGTSLPQAPEWKANFGADYSWEITDSFKAYVGGDVALVSDQISQLDPSLTVRNATTIDGYVLANLNVGVGDVDDRYRLTFSVKNLFDTSFTSLITTGGPGGALRYLIPRDADRYFGATLRVKLGGE